MISCDLRLRLNLTLIYIKPKISNPRTTFFYKNQPPVLVLFSLSYLLHPTDQTTRRSTPPLFSLTDDHNSQLIKLAPFLLFLSLHFPPTLFNHWQQPLHQSITTVSEPNRWVSPLALPSHRKTQFYRNPSMKRNSYTVLRF